jgi:hypothetical protein
MLYPHRLPDWLMHINARSAQTHMIPWLRHQGTRKQRNVKYCHDAPPVIRQMQMSRRRLAMTRQAWAKYQCPSHAGIFKGTRTMLLLHG